MNRHWFNKVIPVMVALAVLFSAPALAAMDIWVDGSAVPPQVMPGSEFEISIKLDLDSHSLGSYHLAIVFDDTAMSLSRVESGSIPELANPIVENIPFFPYLQAWDEYDQSGNCTTSGGVVTLLRFIFKAKETAQPNVAQLIQLDPGIELKDCQNEDITWDLTPYPWGEAFINFAPLQVGFSGISKFMDLDGDGVPTENDAVLMRKIIENDVLDGETSLLSLNGRQCDILGNAISDAYDAGRMDALLRPARMINAGSDGVCDTTAEGDDEQMTARNSGEPNTVVIGPGFNYILDSTPEGDDVISGRRILSGANGIAESTAFGDDKQKLSPGQGQPFGLCISPGVNQEIDSTPAGNDQYVEDPKPLGGMMSLNPEPGVPDRLVLIAPQQNPSYLDQIMTIPITVAVVDKNNQPKAGMSPDFTVISGGGYFTDGAAGGTFLSNLETDLFGDSQGAAKGQVTVLFTPGLGLNQIEVSLSGDASLGIPAPAPLLITIEVLTQPLAHVDHISVNISPTDVDIGDTVTITMTVKDGATPVHGLANRIQMTSKRNLARGMDASGLGQSRLQALFFDQFETGDFTGDGQGPWTVESQSGVLAIDMENPGYFGSYSVKAVDSSGLPPTLSRSIDTTGFTDIQIGYQWAFIPDPTLPDLVTPHFLTEYSWDGIHWRKLKDANGASQMLYGTGDWITDKFNLKSVGAVGNNILHLRYTFDVGAASGLPQTVYLDNVGVTGLKTLMSDDFESYNEGEFPGSMDPMTFVTTGPDGILETKIGGDDFAQMSRYNGQPYAIIIRAGTDGSLESSVGGDDQIGSGPSINSGVNGISETAAAPTDYQEIEVGRGKPWSIGILPGLNGIMDSNSIGGDDEMVGAIGSSPRLEVDSTVGENPDPNQGNNGSQKFMFIGRAANGSSVENYQVGIRADLADYDQATLTFYWQSRSQVDPSPDGIIPAQEFAVEVSDNGGKSWVKIWNVGGFDSPGWTRKEILLYDDDRFNLVNGFMIRWRASMNSTEDDSSDPDGVYLDDISLTAIEPLYDTFSPVIDTMDGQGHYIAYMSSIYPASPAWVSAIYWPVNISPTQDDVPIYGDPAAYININMRKAEPGSIKVYPDEFTLKACKSINVMVVGRFTDTPSGQVEDMTRFFNLEVNGPARQTGQGVITADCFRSNTPVEIYVYAVPKVPGLYDPGGGGPGEQTGDVSGKIYKPNYQGAGDAPIWIDMGAGGKVYSHTDSNGFHFFADVPAGTGYTIASSKEGYTKNYKTINVTAGGNTSASFVLQSGANFDGDDDDDSIDTDDDDDGQTDAQETTAGSSSFDPDTDGDGYPDSVDALPDDPDEWEDTDSDTIGDNEDTDDDGDGILDSEEVIPGSDGYITDPKDPDTDGGGENDGSEVSGGRNPTSAGDDLTVSDTDGDGIEDSDEVLYGTSVSNPDTDGDGLCDGDTSVGVTCVAGEDMDKDGTVDASETDPKTSDTDEDGDSDYIESSTCSNARNYDTDGDGLCEFNTSVWDGSTLLCARGEDLDADGTVDAGETDPCDDDSDSDSIPDGYEKAHGLDPLSDDSAGDKDGDGLNNLAEYANNCDADDWDTDGDHLPDGFEVLHSGDSVALNPLDVNDGDTNFEESGQSDGNPNVHEYWNGTDPWSPDPAPGEYDEPGCFFWGDADGDGAVQANDKNALSLTIAGLSYSYENTIPSNGDGMDLDADGALQAGDMNILKNYIAGTNVGIVLSRATTLTVMEEPGTTVMVGTTCHVSFSVGNDAASGNTVSPSFGVEFWVDTGASTGTAVLLGGEGTYYLGAADNRYDISESVAESARARIVLSIESAGTIVLKAKIPACGVEGVGRWNADVTAPDVYIYAE